MAHGLYMSYDPCPMGHKSCTTHASWEIHKPGKVVRSIWHGVVWPSYGPWTLGFCHVIYSIAHGEKVAERCVISGASGSRTYSHAFLNTPSQRRSTSIPFTTGRSLYQSFTYLAMEKAVRSPTISITRKELVKPTARGLKGLVSVWQHGSLDPQKQS